MSRRPLIAGNWKMNCNRAEGATLARELFRGLPAPLETADVALFPPFTCLGRVVEVVSESEITVGAQNLYPADAGAFTGEISPLQLLDVGATRVLVGHSERRHILGEDDAFVNRKLLAALGHDIEPLLCVGETLAEREAGSTTTVLERQIRGGRGGVAEASAQDVTIAYEPVWAIGTGLTASPDQAAEAHAWIRELLVSLWGEAAAKVRILYGGSAKPENARELLSAPGIDGLLVGGASLSARSFLQIFAAAAG